jgi:23S rRNA pseudouridine1911/1915/1917 synthase
MSDFEVAEPVRLIEFLRRQLPGWKRSTLEQRLRAGAVSVNGQAVMRNDLLAEGDRVALDSLGDAIARRPPPAGITVLYEDSDLVAIDKAPGMLAVAAASDREASALALLRDYLSRNGNTVNLWPAHRIDRETSGVLLFTKSREAQRAVQAAWEAARKTYIALVEGTPRPAQGMIDQPLMEDHALFVRVSDDPRAREARTHYRTLEARGDRALLEVELETGRRHQIRAHFAWLGHPILGDPRYGSSAARMGLHALRLVLPHPHEGRTVTLQAPLPKWFAAR